MRLWLDTETRSSIPLKRGIGPYATRVTVMICAWAIDDGPVQIVDLTDNAPGLELMAAACHADEIWAHNAEFDRTVLETTSWWPLVELERWRCTAALARMHGLPGGLDKLCQIFKLAPEEAKDAGGKEHIQMFCIPRADGKFNDLHSHPKQWAEFVSYGGQDVTAMRACWRKIPKWNATPRMWDVWHLDQRMNEQGVRMDLQLCQGAVNATTRAKRKLADRTEDMTLGVVESATQRDRLLAYMADFGVDLPDLTADTVERRLEDESLPEHIKELLRIRQQASKASTAKYQRVLNQHIHSRLRNLLVFCGASRTGRWAGRTIQPQNLPRPKHEPWKIAQAIELFRADAIELFEPEDVLGLASSCLRGMIIAADGRTLCAADLVNIEGRKMAWFAGEDWKLEAFARYDRKEGPDLYKVSYARSFNIDPDDIADEGDHRRYLGKVQELALQYCGGVGAFCSMAETYGLRLDQLADAAWPIIPERVKEIAREHWIKACKRRRVYGLDKRVWLTCESLVIMWREAHPAIVKFWYDLEQAVATVVHQPHKVVAVGRVQVDRRGNWLRIKLPSGRYLSYPSPRAGDHDTSFVGINPYTKQWCRISTYSGKLAENIVQASSADLLMDGMLAADAAGFNPVLSVHDEIITEPPDDPKFNDKELSRLMISSSPWAAGLPLAAKGFTAKRYAKK